MKNKSKTKEKLLKEIKRLRQRIAKLEKPEVICLPTESVLKKSGEKLNTFTNLANNNYLKRRKIK